MYKVGAVRELNLFLVGDEASDLFGSATPRNPPSWHGSPSLEEGPASVPAELHPAMQARVEAA